MSVTFGVEDTQAVDFLIREMSRPLGAQRLASGTEFSRSLSRKANRRRGGPRVNLVSSEVTLVVDNQIVNGVDFSLSGVQFRSARRLSPGHALMLNIRWRQDPASVALGRVMWATFERPNRLVEPHYRVGVAFENSDVRTLRALLDKCGLGRNVDIQLVQSRL